MTIGIEIKSLDKVYKTASGEIRALDGISFSVAEGERVGIIGENGAGKSTLLQIIAGLASSSAGNCSVEGRVHAALSLGLGLREELSGRKNLYLEAEIQGVERSVVDGYVEKMIDFAELGHFIDEPVRTYSSGMKSRLTFANLVFVDPEILLLDETLSAGDRFFQQKAADAVQDLCDRGKIVIIVSHGIRGLAEMSTRCIWLDKGRIRKDGDPHEVAEAYLAYETKRIEEQAMSNLHEREDNWTASAGQKIGDVTIENSLPGFSAIDSDSPAKISVNIEIEEPVAAPILMISMERMDGIVITENRFVLQSDGKLEKGTFHFEANLDRILVAPSYYMLHVELLDSGRPCARRSIVFRSQATREYGGGTPLLFQPISIEACRA